MKKLSLLLWLACMFGVAKGADPVKVGELYYQLSATNASVSKVPADVAQYQGDVVIPGAITYNGKTYAVNSIDKEAFSGAAQVTSVNIPSSIQSINTDAFKDCSGLGKVTFASAASFGNVAFSNAASNPLSAGDAQLAFANEDNSTDITLASIKKYAFSGYKKEFTLTINGGDVIGDAAFQNCTGLRSIRIPSSVTSIGNAVFSGCTGLTTATFADVESLCSITYASQTSNPLSVSNVQLAFADGASATDVVIPGTVAEVKKYAFYGYGNNIIITLSEGVKTIKENAFQNCMGLSSVEIPSTVTSIGADAFSGCTTLHEVALKSTSGITIGKNAFNNCNQISKVSFASVQSLCGMDFNAQSSNPLAVGNDVELSFASGDDAKDLIIPSGVEKINPYTFYGCKQLMSLSISQGVKTIDQSAFYGCSGLTSVTIPEGLETIETNAFSGCSSLSKASYATEACLCSISYKSEYSNPLSLAHHLWVGDSEIFQVTIPGESLENGVKIKDYILCGASYITRVNIPEEATTVGKSAFKGCSSLESVSFSTTSQVNSMTYEDADANPLKNAKYLIVNNEYVKKLEINEEEVKNNAFANATWLEEVTFSSNVKRIGISAFSGCSNLKKINLENVGQISDYAFKGCAMVKVSIGENCSLGNYVFQNCKELADITLPESLDAIPEGTFYNCEKLKNVKLSSSLSSIGKEAFKNCYKLEILPACDKVKTIYASAFENCYAFTTIDLGNSSIVESIGEKAFYNCTKVTMVSLPTTVTDIYENSFGNCTKLTDVYCHSLSVPAADPQAFGGREGSMKLYVDGTALSEYSNKAPWKNFGEKIAKKECTLSFYINNEKKDEWDITRDNGNTISVEEINQRTPELGEGETFSGWDKAIPQTMPGEDMRFDGYISTTKYVGDFKFQLLPERIENGKSVGAEAVVVGIKKLDSDKDLTVPASVEGYPVTEIGENGFDYNEPLNEGETKSNEWKKYIKRVELPASIKVIGPSAFVDCKGLVEIAIPEGVESIGDNAFESCYKLPGIDLPSSVKIIGKGAFMWCSGMTKVNNFNMDEIADETFFGCSDLLSIELSQVKKLGEKALSKCSSLELEELPASLETIGNQALSGSGIRNATIKATVSLGDAVFKDCAKLETATFEEGFDHPLPQNTFWGCSALKNFTLSSGMNRIGEGAFKECTGLAVISDLKNITAIGREAFMGCSKLTTVKLPASLESMASKAFADGDTLIHIFALGDNAPASTSDAFSDKTYKNENAYVYVNDEAAAERYKAKEPWKNFKNEDGTYRIIVARDYNLSYKVNDEAPKSFELMVGTPIEVLEEPKDAEREDRPFSGWYTVDNEGKHCALPGVMPQSDVDVFGKFKYEVKFYEGEPKADDSNRLLMGQDYEEGFWYWYGESYNLPAEALKKEDMKYSIAVNDQTYDEEEVAGLTLQMSNADVIVIVSYEKVTAELTSGDITYKILKNEGTAAVKEIKENQQEVTIPETIKYEGNSYSVTAIMPKAAKDNKRIQKITLNNVTTIGDDAFYRCLSLSEIKDGLSKVESIGDNAFCGTLFTKITLPANVAKLGKSAFYGCSRLEEVEVNVENISEETFAKCGSYSNTGELVVTLGENVKTIGNNAFDGCGKIKRLIIPASVTTIGEYAFDHVFEVGDIIEILAATPDAYPSIESGTFDEDAYKEAELRTRSISHDDLPGAWANFVNVEEIVGEGAEKCKNPTISYAANKLTFECEEEDATVMYTIKAQDDQNTKYDPQKGLTLSKNFVVTAYAKKSGMISSDVVTETFCFEAGDLNGDGKVNGQDASLVLKLAVGKLALSEIER